LEFQDVVRKNKNPEIAMAKTTGIPRSINRKKNMITNSMFNSSYFVNLLFHQ